MRIYKAMTTIYLPKELKSRLDKLKIHPREPYKDVIQRMLAKWEESEASKEGPFNPNML